MSWVDSKYNHKLPTLPLTVRSTLPADIVCWGGGEGSYPDRCTKDSAAAAKTEAKIHQVLRAKVWASVSSD